MKMLNFLYESVCSLECSQGMYRDGMGGKSYSTTSCIIDSNNASYIHELHIIIFHYVTNPVKANTYAIINAKTSV